METEKIVGFKNQFDNSQDLSLINSVTHFRECPQEPYVSLSHCWGTMEMYKLTRANLPRLLEMIKFDQLPKTFQHAISLSKFKL
jgi:hypothetical protein